MRAALGASRIRLLQQSISESLFLGGIGAVSGCAAAGALLKLIVSVAPDGTPRIQQAHIDARILGFAVAISICCGLLFGLPSAFHRLDIEFLTGWRSVGAPRHWPRHALIVVQIAVSLVLVTGATLLVKTLWNMERTPLGMEGDNVLIARVSLNSQRYPQNSRCAAFFDNLETRLTQAAIPTFALSDSAPPAGAARTHILANIEVESQPRDTQGTGGMVVWRYVTTRYFDVLRIPIRRGRGFSDADREASEDRIVLSEALARRLFPNQDPIGRRMRNAAEGEHWLTVIGVAGDVKNAGFAYPDDPEYYLLRKHVADHISGADNNGRAACSANVIVRLPTSTDLVAAAIRTATASIDPELPVSTDLLRTRIDHLTSRQAFNAALLSAFAAVGVLLAAIGLYAVISFMVVQQTQEIGIRIALGASPSGVVRMTMRYAVKSTSIAILLGIVGSLAAGRLLRSLLFGVSEKDPTMLAVSVTVVLALALVAAWIPSRRASRIDPLVALRCD